MFSKLSKYARRLQTRRLNWTRFNKYLYKYWRLQAVVIGLGLVILPLSLLNPYLTKLIIDKAYGNKDLRLFFTLAIIGGSIFIVTGLVNSLISYLTQRIKCRVHFDMTKDMFRHLQGLELSFFNNKSTGEHIFRIDHDVNLVRNFICDTIPEIIKLFPRLLFILVIVFYLNWKLALFASFLVPISYIQPYFFGKWLRKMRSKLIEKSQDIFRGLHEAFTHMHLIKALGRENYEIRRFEENLSKRIDFELKDARLFNFSHFSSSILNKVISGIIALYGGYQVIRGTMTLGSLTAVMLYLTQLIRILGSIGRLYETITINSISRQRLAEILDIKSRIIDKEGAREYRISQGRIELRNVCFGYKEDDTVLKRLNLLITPASKIALVGPSGCGKTTLLSLILRLYEPREGSILIDGLDIKDMKLESMRAQIGIALQEPFLWNESVAWNIRYGKENAGEEEILSAARLAEADDFITRLPEGYESVIGEMGVKISEGQKQRIAIARAIIKNPKILLLDEAMSSLDSETEDRIIDNILREFRNATVIIVSHRLSAVKKMGLVYFLESPNNIMVGTHEELIELNPKYRELFLPQTRTQTENLNYKTMIEG